MHGRFDLFASRQTESERERDKKKRLSAVHPREREEKREKSTRRALFQKTRRRMKLTRMMKSPIVCSIIIYLRGGAQRRRDKVLPFPPDDRRVRTRRIPPGLFFGIVFLVLVFPSSSPSFWGVGLFVCHVVVAGGGVGVRHYCVTMSLSQREGRRKVTTEKGE